MADGPSQPRAEAAAERRVETASLSDVGLSRTENQDFCGQFSDTSGNRLLVLADGMGGHRGGATASQICVETVAQIFADETTPLDRRLRNGIELANRRIFEAAAADSALQGMGTTAVALALPPTGDAVIAWVGDSRAYRFRRGQLQSLSQDHSVVAEWVRMGMISPEEAETHPRRNELMRSVGGLETVEVDLISVEVEPGDRFLLCSDGLCGYVPETEIAAVLGFEAPARAASSLVDKANATGGYDNVTVQIAAVGETEAPAAIPDDANAEVEPVELKRAGVRPLVAAVGVVTVMLGGALFFAYTRGGGGIPEARRESNPVVGARALARANVPASEREEIEQPAPPAPSPEPLARTTRPEPRAEPLAPLDSEPPASEAGIEVVQESPPLGEPTAEPAEPPSRVEQTAEPAVAAELTAADASETAAPAALEPEDRPSPASDNADAPNLSAAIDRFLEGWSRSVVEKNYPLHRELGFSISEHQFEQRYGRRKDLVLSFVRLDYARPEPGLVNVRVRMTFGYRDRTGPHRSEKERRVVLRETGADLSYSGTWD